MFFFGAFSGNLLYIILAISYLAGFSALAFRSPENQVKDIKSSEAKSAPVMCDNTFHAYYTTNTNLADQALSEEISAQSPVIFYSRFLFISPPTVQKFHFSGSAILSRPPPYLMFKSVFQIG